jgi:hypothetical protein
MTHDELRALCAQATAGPWYAHNPDDEVCMNAYAVTTSPGEPVVDASPPNDHEQIVALTLLQSPRVVCHAAGRWEADARFIAAAREAVPALLDENARLRAARQELEAVVAWIEDLAVFSQTDPSAPTKAELLRQLRAALEAANA